MSTTPESQQSSGCVAAAERCDAAGEHTEAIKHLVAGARSNDVEAITRLGKRLLIGDRAPRLPNDGARLINDASELGGAEAAALLSVLFAVGANRNHDFRSALDCLAVAAERGWVPAQEQLTILASRDAADGAEPSMAWRQLAAGIDLARWQRAENSMDLNSDPLVRLLPDFASPAICRWMIEKARGRLSRALVYDSSVRKTIAHHTRTNTAAVFNLLDTDIVCVLLQTRMSACIGVPFRHLEATTVLHYAEGEEISEHFDFVDPEIPGYEQEIAQQGQRMVTFLVYLNDDYTGGETEFPRLGISHRGRRGEGLFFINALNDGRPDMRTLHAGRPPVRGEKWIVSQFVRNRPVL